MILWTLRVTYGKSKRVIQAGILGKVARDLTKEWQQRGKEDPCIPHWVTQIRLSSTKQQHKVSKTKESKICPHKLKNRKTIKSKMLTSAWYWRSFFNFPLMWSQTWYKTIQVVHINVNKFLVVSNASSDCAYLNKSVNRARNKELSIWWELRTFWVTFLSKL